MLIYYGPYAAELQNASAFVYILVFAPVESGIFILAAYWAFSIRRALAAQLYRRQALGIGLVSLTFLISLFSNTSIAFGYWVLVIFYWIDASFYTARRSDPLLRDTLHWRQLRYLIWPLTAVGPLFSTFLITLNQNLNYAPPDNSTIANILNTLYAPPFFLVPALGIALIAIVARRSKGHAHRRHITWFGGLPLMQFAGLFAALTTGLGVSYFLGFEVGGLCLYMSARSLAPLNKLSLVELTSPLGKETSLRPDVSYEQLVKASSVMQ